jgi:hypothetical protein
MGNSIAPAIMNLFPFMGCVVVPPVLEFILDKMRSPGGAYVDEDAFRFMLAASVIGIAGLLFMKGTTRAGT